MKVLIDGDLLRYRCGFAAEKTHYLAISKAGYEYVLFDSVKDAKEAGYTKEELWTKKEVEPVENCLQIVKEVLNGIVGDVERYFKVPKAVSNIYISGRTNFRDSVATSKPYKGNRDPSHKPVHYRAIGEYLTEVWGAVTVEGIEADDEISIQSMVEREAGKPYVVVSNDKDLDQIPGWHYDWTKKEFYEVSAREAKTRFFIQLLSGDSTDNIPGLPGIGEAKAAKALSECKSPIEMISTCIAMYLELSKGLDYLVEQATLVYIQRKPNENWLKDTTEGSYVAACIARS